MAVVTIVYLKNKKQILVSEAQRVAKWLEHLGENARPCPAGNCRRPADHSGPHYSDGEDALPAGAKTATFTIGTHRGQAFIQCRICRSRSFHPEDVKQRYCGTCHQFHEILLQMQSLH